MAEPPAKRPRTATDETADPETGKKVSVKLSVSQLRMLPENIRDDERRLRSHVQKAADIGLKVLQSTSVTLDVEKIREEILQPFGDQGAVTNRLFKLFESKAGEIANEAKESIKESADKVFKNTSKKVKEASNDAVERIEKVETRLMGSSSAQIERMKKDTVEQIEKVETRLRNSSSTQIERMKKDTVERIEKAETSLKDGSQAVNKQIEEMGRNVTAVAEKVEVAASTMKECNTSVQATNAMLVQEKKALQEKKTHSQEAAQLQRTSSLKGKTMEERVLDHLDSKIFADMPDVVSKNVSTQRADVGKSKKGDILVTFKFSNRLSLRKGTDPRAQGPPYSRCVVEVKAGTFTLKGKDSLENQLTAAMDNYNAEFGVAVVSHDYLESSGTHKIMPAFTVKGDIKGRQWCTVIVDSREPETGSTRRDDGWIPLLVAMRYIQATAKLRAHEEMLSTLSDTFANASKISGFPVQLRQEANSLVQDMESVRTLKGHVKSAEKELAGIRTTVDELNKKVIERKDKVIRLCNEMEKEMKQASDTTPPPGASVQSQ